MLINFFSQPTRRDEDQFQSINMVKTTLISI